MKAREIWAVVFLCAIGLTAITIIDSRNPTADHTAINTIIIGFVGTMSNSLIAAMRSNENSKKLEDVHSDLKDNTAVTAANTASIETLKAAPNVTIVNTEEPK